MEKTLICLAIALVVGLLMSRLAKLVHLPAVTAYLVGGLLIGPFCLGALNLPYIGFNSLEQVEGLSVITQTALGFIAFAIGNEFRVSQLKTMGKQAITVGILQAVITTIVVDIALIVLHLINPALLSLPSAITLGAIAAATAPAATLMVVRQYKADGPLTKLLLMVVAIDDAVGLVLFSVSFGIAGALEMGSISVVSVILEPIIEIVISLVLGALSGLALNWLETYFHSRSKRLSLTVAFVLLMVGISSMEFELGGVKIGFSLLLVCMMTGTVFCNVCSASEELMSRLDRWTGPINILFFVLSGAELDLNILSNPLNLPHRKVFFNLYGAEQGRCHDALVLKRQAVQHGDALVRAALIFARDVEKDVLPTVAPVIRQTFFYALRALCEQEKRNIPPLIHDLPRFTPPRVGLLQKEIGRHAHAQLLAAFYFVVACAVAA